MDRVWKYDGSKRPPFAADAGPGQESVWDYSRPPPLEADSRRVIVRHGGVVIADTVRSIRVLETASPPTFYLPPEDVDRALLNRAEGSSFCEWKGAATYWSVVAQGEVLTRVGWSYGDPFPEFEGITDYLSFYPARLDCSVDGVRVKPQPGGFYGGWITQEITGPFKGEGDSAWW